MKLLNYIHRNKFEVLLFDLDGTLLDSALCNAKGYQAALFQCGLSIQLKKIDEISKGKNWRQFLPKLLIENESNIDPEIVAKIKHKLYIGDNYNPIPNHELVQIIKLMYGKKKLGVVTTASIESAIRGLKFLGVTQYIDVMVTGSDVDKFKPHPEPYEKALQMLNIDPSKALVFEDADVGISSAKAAGISAIVIVNMHNNSYKLAGLSNPLTIG